MKKLIRGILDFRKNMLPDRREAFARLAHGQTPDTLFVTCSDSRVAPNWFASTDPGDLFVIRNVGNFVPPCPAPPYDDRTTSGRDHSVAAALDFALLSLKVSHIVVCGHSGCGAIHALAEGIDKLPVSGLKSWLMIGERSLARAPSSGQAAGADSETDSHSALSHEDQLSQKSTLQQIENIKTYPEVQRRLADGSLTLHAWWFNIASAGVHAYDKSSKRFVLIDEEIGNTLLAALK